MYTSLAYEVHVHHCWGQLMCLISIRLSWTWHLRLALQHSSLQLKETSAWSWHTALQSIPRIMDHMASGTESVHMMLTHSKRTVVLFYSSTSSAAHLSILRVFCHSDWHTVLGSALIHSASFKASLVLFALRVALGYVGPLGMPIPSKVTDSGNTSDTHCGSHYSWVAAMLIETAC